MYGNESLNSSFAVRVLYSLNGDKVFSCIRNKMWELRKHYISYSDIF